MDKLHILKEFEKLALRESLGLDDVRLYLLLLAHCDSRGGGTIAWRIIEDALGWRFSTVRLQRACHHLSELDLIALASPLPDGASAADFTVAYTISSLQRQRRRGQ